ncbi:MAG: redoxin domain-containing protein [Clostridiaceae bacterium]|nr:redoxin domain-containing protein [Clostridiaceae bacterium]
MKRKMIVMLIIALLIISRYTIFDDKNKDAVLPPVVEDQNKVLQEENVLVDKEEPVIGVKVGNIAPDFILTDLDGVERNLADYKGKDVMLYFWVST